MVDSREREESGPPRRSRPFNFSNNSNAVPVRPGRIPQKGSAWPQSHSNSHPAPSTSNGAGPGAGAAHLPARPGRLKSPPPGAGLPPLPFAGREQPGPPPGRGWGEPRAGPRGWGGAGDGRARSRERGQGWDRDRRDMHHPDDDYRQGPPHMQAAWPSTSRGPPPRTGYFPGERERDRERRASAAAYEGPPAGAYRGEPYPRKRSRGSSDDESEAGIYGGRRSRHTSPVRGRRGSLGAGGPPPWGHDFERGPAAGGLPGRRDPAKRSIVRYADEPVPPLPSIPPVPPFPAARARNGGSVNDTPAVRAPNPKNGYTNISQPQRSPTPNTPTAPAPTASASKAAEPPAPRDEELAQAGTGLTAAPSADSGTPPPREQPQPARDDVAPSTTSQTPPEVASISDAPTPSTSSFALVDAVEIIEPTPEQVATVRVEQTAPTVSTIDTTTGTGTGTDSAPKDTPHPLQASMERDLFAGAVVPQPVQEVVKPILISGPNGVTDAVEPSGEKVVFDHIAAPTVGGDGKEVEQVTQLVEDADGAPGGADAPALPADSSTRDPVADEQPTREHGQPAPTANPEPEPAPVAVDEARIEPAAAEPASGDDTPRPAAQPELDPSPNRLAELPPDEATPVLSHAQLPTISPAQAPPSTPPQAENAVLPTSPLSSLKPTSPAMPSSHPPSPLVEMKSQPAPALEEVEMADVEAPVDPDATSPAPLPSDVLMHAPDERAKPHVERDFPPLEVDVGAHELIGPFLVEHFAERDERRGVKMIELRREYKAINEDWVAHCNRLDKLKRRFAPSTHPGTPSIDASGLPFYPSLHAEVSTPGASIGPAGGALGGSLLAPTARASRRSARDAYGHGDAARSEAEFLAILQDLETADLRDPTVRASRTAAVVPDLILDEDERRAFVNGGLDDDERRRVLDPVEFYETMAEPDGWTQDEVEVYCTRFTATPKQFGLIAEHIPAKSTAECVLFYYRMKNVIDFRVLSNRPGRDGRKRKLKKRAADGKKGASLLSNLKRPPKDELEQEADADLDEDDTPIAGGCSPPGSPQAGRKTIDKDPPFKPRRGATKEVDYRETPDGELSEPSRQTARKSRASQAAREAVAAAAASNNLAPPPGMGLAPPSDGTLEAAEALGTLLGAETAEDQSDEAAYAVAAQIAQLPSLPAAALTAAGAGGMPGAVPGKRNNSYWTVGERELFRTLLEQYGKDFERISAELVTKTATQCRNFFTNQNRRLAAAQNATTLQSETDDSAASRPLSPIQQHQHQIPSVLQQPHGAGGPVLPRAGFFTNDAPRGLPVQGGFAAVHDRAQSNGIPSLLNNMPPRPEDPFFKKKSMGIRSLLNEDTPDEEQPASVNAGDWFGGGGGLAPSGEKEEGSVTTVDEEEAASRSEVIGRRQSLGAASAIGLNGMERSYSAGTTATQPFVSGYRFEEQRPASVVGYHAQHNNPQQHHSLAHHRPHLASNGASYHSAPGSVSGTPHVGGYDQPQPLPSQQLSPRQSRLAQLSGGWSSSPVVGGYSRQVPPAGYEYQRKLSGGEHGGPPARQEYDYHHQSPALAEAEYYPRAGAQPQARVAVYRDTREVEREREQREREYFEPRAASTYRQQQQPTYGPAGGSPPQWR